MQHVIAAKAVAMRIAASETFKERQQRTIDGAKALVDQLLMARGAGEMRVLTGGTDVHLLLVDLRAMQPELTGRQAEDRLHEIGITVNRNAVPFDPRPPMEASGLRIGTPALATRGLQVQDFVEIGQIIGECLMAEDFDAVRADLASQVEAIARRCPLYEELTAPVST